MDGGVVYNSVINALRKDQRGLSLTVDEFNLLSPIIDKRILAQYCSTFEEDIDSTDDLAFLKVVGRTINLTTGVGTLPSNYYWMTGEPYYTDTSVTPNKVRYIDVLTSKEHGYRERDYLTKATTTYPTCTLGTQSALKETQIRVTPTTITSIKIDYLRDTVTPFLDYYVNDTTKIITFIATGVSVTVASGSTYRTGTTGTFQSATIDWEWGMSDLPLIVAYFLEALGATIPDEILLQAGMKDKIEIQNT